MSASPNTKDLKIDPASVTDRLFILFTSLFKIRGGTIRYMNVLRLNIDVIEKSLVDLRMKLCGCSLGRPTYSSKLKVVTLEKS